MVLLLLAFLGGVLTIVSPCILPVLPLVFSGAGRSFRRSGLPLLAGMAGTFALFAGIATYTGAWVVRANQIGRAVALIAFAIFGLALLLPGLAARLTAPLVRLGAKLAPPAGDAEPSVARSVLLGVSTGLLWAPCAGPILGLILTGAAVSGPNARTTVLLLAFAAGAGTSLAVALLAGGRVFHAMKRSLGAEEWIRRGLGVAVLLGVVAIATGADTGILRRISLASSSGFEQRLIDRLRPRPSAPPRSGSAAPIPALANEGPAPAFEGATSWLNSPPLSRQSLSGKVVVVDFWTYSCINCLRSIPYVEAWAKKYQRDGLVVVGVHTPEFAFERDSGNVARAVKDLGITYPVAIDSKYTIWNAFHNEYWPAHYFIDASGVIRSHHFGEGAYEEGEAIIRRLLEEKGTPATDSTPVEVVATGAQAAAANDIRSRETYVGYERTTNYASLEPILPDHRRVYSVPSKLSLNQWALGGTWNVNGEHASLITAPGKVVFRFHARDLHLVLGPAADGKPIRCTVKLDGKAPGSDHGADVNSAGSATVTSYRLYQLIRQHGPIQDHTFEIDFLDPGVEVFAFTFG